MPSADRNAQAWRRRSRQVSSVGALPLHGTRAAEHPQHDLGAIAEERMARRMSAAIEDLDHVAGRSLDPGDVGLVDPGMSVAQALFAALRDGDAGHHVIIPQS